MIRVFEIRGRIGRAFYAEANIEVRAGGAALHAISANRSNRWPGFLMSQFHGNQPAGDSNSADGTIRALELVRGDHVSFAPRQTFSRRSSSAVDQLVAK